MSLKVTLPIQKTQSARYVKIDDNHSSFFPLMSVQYKIYLFEMILLCCKEMNTNKQKNKVLGKSMLDSKGRPKLQLKGRIFMQNVTDTVTSAKPGLYR
jgi:Pleckstrin homology domain